ncbi:MAG: 50S ribosomal protein L21 [Candidatus Margulisiibacteriota bacterium]|nr:MAG: 50S ribosomal protein L21 [Candidatus Margulisbacteria bacterium GWD2_39_127]OGI03728.1 MAG: 50S ribosomal protein L21 [Candidatus Margulisbacteria bacterium GWF2_38_17]OGI06848.1 MAG: 50S ribosomal protein L21 [Candidatus Margulisbacteria bacterium GWE2_39_32]PZM77057.1 MAG: 50S ribosomal protein L21 [Candidatus Margulisiibacteriota bacterium]HAR64443.1 50S ribosomal protein L21 [Candidatus Margulisiibacteriota bacterium]
MYAVIETGSKQYKVKIGSTIFIEKLEAENSSKVEFNKVLLLAGEGDPIIGMPYVENAKVVGTLIETAKDDKVIIYKFKRKTGYRRKNGHRQLLSQVKIETIEAGSISEVKETSKIGIPAEVAAK